ncbi:Uncharacterised protein [Salmonella enterica subsp. enterica]|uniref:Uncharacterized protein n=1 Tax=Salmonella enterica I TaxID=59201 RepID=A0A447TPT9_SALET|nr:Uncharacterised protein [Salmonella enterica subsp. enterica]
MPRFHLLQINAKGNVMCPENENGPTNAARFFRMKAELDSPAAGIKSDQRDRNDDSSDIQLTPFTGNQTPDDQRGKADHNPGDNVYRSVQ